MKTFKLITTVLALVLISISFISCGNSKKKDAEAATENVSKVSKDGKEYTSAYICPMHCKDSGSDKAGDCPVCGMAYKKNKDYKGNVNGHEGHDHSGHEGHDHSGHEGHDHSGHDHGDHSGHNH